MSIMSTSKFHRNHEQHISLSEKLSVQVKAIGQDALNQIKNLDSDTSKQLLLTVINRVVGDTFNVIRDLQEIVIKSNTEGNSSVALKDVVQKLSQNCNEMVQGYNSSSNILKQNFALLVQNIILEAECLLNIIKNDDLHDFKHALVESLKELLYTIHVTQVRMQIQNYSQQELNDAIETIQKEYFDDIAEIEKCNLEVLKNLLIHIRHTVKHNYQAVYYLHKAVSNFDDAEIHHKILESTNSMNIATSTFLVDSENCNSIQEIIAILKNASLNCWSSFIELFRFIDSGHENQRTAAYLRDIQMYLVSYGFVVNKQIGRFIRHDTLFV